MQIIQFAYECTCSGRFEVEIDDLPPIITFSTDLNQKTVILRGTPDTVEKGITYIVGKPGVGKSHYVNELINAFPDAIIYRFWIGQQDPKLNDRLRFDIFLEQIGLRTFQSPKAFTQDQLIDELVRSDRILVVDGLDHVENYNPNDLQKFIDFFNRLNDRQIRLLILARPMKIQLWDDKQELLNWTYDETALYLATAYNVTDYSVQKKVFEISDGYPIITFFLAEHYKKYGEFEADTPITDINDYYEELLSKVGIKSLLSIFAVNNSFFTERELQNLIGQEIYPAIQEFILSYPYLFDRVENRVALIHDSLNTYLRSQLDGYETWKAKVNDEVYTKMLSGDIEYMARLSSFNLDESQIRSILKRHSDFDVFKSIMLSTVDYNSIAAFYEQLRRLLESRPDVLDIYQYYSFALIFQIVTRNDLIGYEGLIFQILQYVHKNGDIENQIYNSDIMWQVYLACKDQPKSIKRYMENTMYGDTQLNSAYDSINEEIQFFDCLECEPDALKILQEVDSIKGDSLKQSDMLQEYLVTAWIQRESELPFFNEFKAFVENDIEDTIYIAIQSAYHFDKFWAERVYYAARYRLHELGLLGERNICRQGSILSIIKKEAPEGSFSVAPAVLSFLRLANHEDRMVDICNINYVWSMYAQRKDYSVHTIDSALVTFESEELIEEEDSFEIIHRLMKQSEKGIRHLLASYIDLKGSEYVKRLVASGKIFDADLQLDIFELNTENIDCLPSEAIKDRLVELIRYHRRTEYVDGYEIRNVLRSKYGKIICDALDYFDKKVVDGLDDEGIKTIKESGIEYISKDDQAIREEYMPFRNGCISRDDFDYIKNNKISIMECSRYADGWYTCLPYVDLYELFDISKVRDQYLGIIHQALFARVVSNEHIGNWNDIIGNIPAFLEKYEISVDWGRLFKIMLHFLDLSVIYYPEISSSSSHSTENDTKEGA